MKIEERVLAIYDRLLKGDSVNRIQAANEYNADERTISRDVARIESYLHLYHPGATVDYDRQREGYILSTGGQYWLTKEEVLTLAKVVLESRAFSKAEMGTLVDKLLYLCEPNNKTIVKDAVGNERFHYQPPGHNQALTERIWELNQAIRKQRLIEIVYHRVGDTAPVTRTVAPLAIMFSEFYFYLIANRIYKDYKYPAIYRLDRICEYKITDARFPSPHATPFEEGEFRKRVQFMHHGEKQTVRFRFWGPSLEATLDRLPTAKVLSNQNGVAEIEAEIYGPGIMMWLLSQGANVEVLSPLQLREKMREVVKEMQNIYV